MTKKQLLALFVSWLDEEALETATTVEMDVNEVDGYAIVIYHDWTGEPVVYNHEFLMNLLEGVK